MLWSKFTVTHHGQRVARPGAARGSRGIFVVQRDRRAARCEAPRGQKGLSANLPHERRAEGRGFGEPAAFNDRKGIAEELDFLLGQSPENRRSPPRN